MIVLGICNRRLTRFPWNDRWNIEILCVYLTLSSGNINPEKVRRKCNQLWWRRVEGGRAGGLGGGVYPHWVCCAENFDSKTQQQTGAEVPVASLWLLNPCEAKYNKEEKRLSESETIQRPPLGSEKHSLAVFHKVIRKHKISNLLLSRARTKLCRFGVIHHL